MTINLCARLSPLVIILFFCASCAKRSLGPCTGNCEVVYFSGIAVDPGAQKPLANLPVTVTMVRKDRCTLCGEIEVATGKTKGDGTFAITKSVDTTQVVPGYCTINMQGPSGYIVYALPTGPGIPADGNVAIGYPLFVDSTGMAPYREYDFFKPVAMTIKLHRTGAIVSSEPFVSLDFTIGAGSLSAYILDELPSNGDTTITMNTGANVFTRVKTIAWLTDSTKSDQTDSVRCVAGGSNTLQVNYP
jgi:hypothetical protein